MSEAVSPLRLPRWNELPDLDIYMDQVLSLLSRYLRDLPGLEEKGLTASMVNNYVKQGILPAPVGKRYNRTHLACLLIITILKSVLPIGSIGRILRRELESGRPCDELYDRFCDTFESAGFATAESAGASEDPAELSRAIFRAALRSRAEQALALRMLGSLPDPDPAPRKR
ncbi:MAG: DUF1836 domain-containing protein [Oscillospiraceae bacterium]|nr:DUF1836 domain-containing protein [Oscillospiraceae bacterium]